MAALATGSNDAHFCLRLFVLVQELDDTRLYVERITFGAVCFFVLVSIVVRLSFKRRNLAVVIPGKTRIRMGDRRGRAARL